VTDRLVARASCCYSGWYHILYAGVAIYLWRYVLLSYVLGLENST